MRRPFTGPLPPDERYALLRSIHLSHSSLPERGEDLEDDLLGLAWLRPGRSIVRTRTVPIPVDADGPAMGNFIVKNAAWLATLTRKSAP